MIRRKPSRRSASVFLAVSLLVQLSLLPADSHALGWVGESLNGVSCQGRGQGFGPYDYFDVNERSDPLYNEGRIWEADDRHLRQGFLRMSQDPLGQADYERATAEFDYMLRAFPNHPQALQGVVKLELKRQTINKASSTKLNIKFPPPECYLQRAAFFRPNQPHIRILYGVYLHQMRHYDKAIDQYLIALQHTPASAEAHYNIGLAYLAIDDLPKAIEHAETSYKLGYPLPGLRRLLRKRGYQIAADLP